MFGGIQGKDVVSRDVQLLSGSGGSRENGLVWAQHGIWEFARSDPEGKGRGDIGETVGGGKRSICVIGHKGRGPGRRRRMEGIGAHPLLDLRVCRI